MYSFVSVGSGQAGEVGNGGHSNGVQRREPNQEISGTDVNRACLDWKEGVWFEQLAGGGFKQDNSS